MATSDHSTTFYVYALARPVKKGSSEYRIFYIGKGTKRRVFRHEWEARAGRKGHRYNIIRKVWRDGGEIQRYILLTTQDEQEAFEYEKQMIALHGRENLCNQTNGGEGPSGRSIPDDELARRSERVRQARQTPESRKRTSEINREWWSNLGPEERSAHMRKVTGNQKGKVLSEETRRKISQSKKGKPLSESAIQKMRGREVSEETRRKMSEARKGRATRGVGWKTGEETRRKQSASIQAVRSTVESRSKTSAASKAMWSDPEKRAKILAARKKSKQV